jgi:hypothetical protein
MRRGRLLNAGMSLLCLALLVVACGWFQGTIQVDPTPLNEVRKIGTVRGESRMHSDVNGKAEITNYFVIDVGGTDDRDAVNEAVKNLQAQEWSIVAENRPARVLMKSDKWAGVHLSVTPFDPVNLNGVPELLTALGGETVRTEGLVIIDVYKFT